MTMRQPKRLFKRPPHNVDRIADVAKKVQGDLDALDWPEADASIVKAACLGAVLNAFMHETRKGFRLPAVASVYVRNQEQPDLHQVPAEVQGNDHFEFLSRLGATTPGAELVSYAFIDVDEDINVLVLKPDGLLYYVLGRIEGITFVRTKMQSQQMV